MTFCTACAIIKYTNRTRWRSWLHIFLKTISTKYDKLMDSSTQNDEPTVKRAKQRMCDVRNNGLHSKWRTHWCFPLVSCSNFRIVEAFIAIIVDLDGQNIKRRLDDISRPATCMIFEVNDIHFSTMRKFVVRQCNTIWAKDKLH